MKYIVHYSTGYTFTFFCKSVLGAKQEAMKRTSADFFNNKQNYICIYQFDAMMPLATRNHKGWTNH